MTRRTRGAGAANPAAISVLPQPGDMLLPGFPRALASNAPWLFVVYLGFHAGWTPTQLTVLLIVLLPYVALSSRNTR